MEYVTVRGARIPALGFGTARLTGTACADAVRTALELGYRHIDTAQLYDNEAAVGAAVADADVDRADVFLTTKLRPDNLASDDVLDSVEGSLDRLGTEYVDLLLIHAPGDAPVAETLAAMNRLQAEGRVEHVGVSNFSVDQLAAAEDASETPVLTNQVEYHPYERRDELLAYCRERDVALTAYSPLAGGDVADDETLREIGARYGKSASQVALRWLLRQENVVAIPKAAGRAHQAENVDVFDFDLTDEETERIANLKGSLGGRIRRALGL